MSSCSKDPSPKESLGRSPLSSYALAFAGFKTIFYARELGSWMQAWHCSPTHITLFLYEQFMITIVRAVHRNRLAWEMP
jgi:hypothetical protein